MGVTVRSPQYVKKNKEAYILYQQVSKDSKIGCFCQKLTYLEWAKKDCPFVLLGNLQHEGLQGQPHQQLAQQQSCHYCGGKRSSPGMVKLPGSLQSLRNMTFECLEKRPEDPDFQPEHNKSGLLGPILSPAILICF